MELSITVADNMKVCFAEVKANCANCDSLHLIADAPDTRERQINIKI